MCDIMCGGHFILYDATDSSYWFSTKKKTLQSFCCIKFSIMSCKWRLRWDGIGYSSTRKPGVPCIYWGRRIRQCSWRKLLVTCLFIIFDKIFIRKHLFVIAYLFLLWIPQHLSFAPRIVLFEAHLFRLFEFWLLSYMILNMMDKSKMAKIFEEKEKEKT